MTRMNKNTVGVKNLHTPDINMFHLIFCKIIHVCKVFSSLRWLNIISTTCLWNNFHHHSVLKNFWGIYWSFCIKSSGQKFTYTHHKIMLHCLYFDNFLPFWGWIDWKCIMFTSKNILVSFSHCMRCKSLTFLSLIV